MTHNHGYLEMGRGGWWDHVINLEVLLRPDYGDVARMLFLPGSVNGFVPPFAGRGYPPGHPGGAGQKGAREQALPPGPSWATLEEIESVDWSALGPLFDGGPVSRFRLNPQPTADSSFWLFDGYASREELVGREGIGTWESRGFTYQRGRRSRQDVLERYPDWRVLFRMMRALTRERTTDGIRLVMWFTE